MPALLNAPPPILFIENIPLRDLPPVINTVPGAMEIQTVIDNTVWVWQAGNPVAYAPHLGKSPLHGIDPPPVIIQFAKGDQTVSNSTASAIFRAGDLSDRSTYFRQRCRSPGTCRRVSTSSCEDGARARGAPELPGARRERAHVIDRGS